MIDSKKKEIINKISNGNYILTSEENYILKNDLNLLIKVIELIEFNNKDIDKIIEVVDIILLEKYGLDFEKMSTIMPKNTLIKSILFTIYRENLIDLSVIKPYIEVLELSDEDLQVLQNMCDYVKNNKEDYNISGKYLLSLLDQNEYETISKVLYVQNYSDNNVKDNIITKRLIEEFPFDKYTIKFIERKNLRYFSSIKNKANIIYSLIIIDSLSEEEIDVLIKRLENGEKIELKNELINRIDFDYIINLKDEKGDKIIKLLFKNSPEVYFYLEYFEYFKLDKYSSYVRELILNSLDENTRLPDKMNIYEFKNDEKLIRKLIETKHYKFVANNFNILEDFDILSNYITKNNIDINCLEFMGLYNIISNKETLKRLIKEEKLKISVQDNPNREFIDFLVSEDFDNIIYYIILYNYYDLNEIITNYKEYFINKIASNSYFMFELFNTNFENILKMDFDTINKLFQIVINNEEYIDIILSKIEELDTKENLDQLFDILLPYIDKYMYLDTNKINLLKNKFGSNILKYLRNEQFTKVLNLDYSKLEKFVNLFSNVKYTMKDLEASFDSIVQSQFAINNPDDVSIFQLLEEYIRNNDERYLLIVSKLLEEIDNQALNYFNNKLHMGIINPREYILNLIKMAKVSGNYDILHQICIYYLDKKRGKYKNSINMGEVLDLPYDFEETSLKKGLVKEYLKDGLYYSVILEIERETGYSNNEIEEAIKFYLGKVEIKDLVYDFNDIKKIIPILITKVTEVLKKLPRFLTRDYLNKLKNDNSVKKIYHLDESMDFYQVLCELDFELIEKNVLDDIEIYNKLQAIMNNLKLYKLPESLIRYLQDNHLFDVSSSTFSSFINYFSSIIEKINNDKSSRMNLATILRYTSIYDSMSSIYKVILGDTDYALIKSNPPLNAAQNKTKNNERVIEATNDMIECFKRQVITIPAFNEIIELGSGKKIRAVLGNFTNPCNMTHGERTGACMRIGGHAEKLFNFCLKNPNGFHLRFEDAETSEYVSRASGFRNGNTIVFNQLRSSLTDDYLDSELVEAIRLVGQKLIRETKDSSYPIQNAIMDAQYAAIGLDTVNIGEQSVKGLFDVYSDIDVKAVVVSSIAKDGIVPINFSQNNLPMYPVARDIPKKITDINQFIKLSSRISAIKKAIQFKSYDYIANLEFENGFIIGIVGDDFYCYLDSNYDIHEEYIEIDERGQVELAKALEDLKNYKIAESTSYK
ncbi:MAG: hypothetical protein IKN63_00300 [Bacilli bacterium]|nr:hypothetical protein [Bacilli bacterium]